MAGLTGWHLVIIIAVVLVLFGAKRLPDMARALGQSARIFKSEIKGAGASGCASSITSHQGDEAPD